QAPSASAPLFREGESGLCRFWRGEPRPVRNPRLSPLRRKPRIGRAIGAGRSQALPARTPDAGAVTRDGNPATSIARGGRLRGGDGRGGNSTEAPVGTARPPQGRGSG